jgi:hypothetical protein
VSRNDWIRLLFGWAPISFLLNSVSVLLCGCGLRRRVVYAIESLCTRICSCSDFGGDRELKLNLLVDVEHDKERSPNEWLAPQQFGVLMPTVAQDITWSA